MATMSCAAAAVAGIGGLPPCGTAKPSSQGKRMQVLMSSSNNTASSNRLSLLQALSQQAAAQSQRCKHWFQLHCPSQICCERKTSGKSPQNIPENLIVLNLANCNVISRFFNVNLSIVACLGFL